MSKPEQIDRHEWSPAIKKAYKKEATRTMRRDGKRLLDEAPVKPLRKGWSL